MSEKVRHNKSNRAWITEHVNDSYVQRARAEGWRSRAVFKLTEIDTADKLLQPGMTIVDLGCAPGSWSQFAAKRVTSTGRVIGLDLLPMGPLHGVEFILGDFREAEVLRALEISLDGRQVDLVLSDMAPNMSGIALVDQARVMLLAELTLEFCNAHLKVGGDMLVKVFQGDGFMELREEVKRVFKVLHVRKPSASRDRSAEIYLLAKGKRG